MPRPLITLTSDFGTTDGYVASMKGVMLTICPEVTLVDISHHVPPRDVAHGAFVLGSAYCYFPAGTVHVAVVDPGVGSSRHPVLLTTRTHTFLAPDNGLLSHVLARYQQTTLIRRLNRASPSKQMRPGFAFPCRTAATLSCWTVASTGFRM